MGCHLARMEHVRTLIAIPSMPCFVVSDTSTTHHTSIFWFGHFELCQRLTSAGRGCESLCSKGRCCKIGSRACFHVTSVDLLPKTSGTYLPNLQHQKGTSTPWEHRSLGLLKDWHTRTSQCPSYVDVCAVLYGSNVFFDHTSEHNCTKGHAFGGRRIGGVCLYIGVGLNLRGSSLRGHKC
jgi:hypothetical protein